MAEVGHFNELLTRLNYDISEPTLFGGQKAVYDEAKKIDRDITFREVKRWFAGQPTATVWHPTVRPKRNPYIQARVIITCSDTHRVCDV